MPTLGVPELLILLVLILILFGPGKVARIGRELGSGVRAFSQERGPDQETESTIAQEPPLLVFVSSRIEEFESERSILNQTISKIPVFRSWVFEFTPASSIAVDDAYLQKVQECDFFVLLIGEDISPAVEAEVNLARDCDKPILAFVRGGGRSESAESLIASLESKWYQFADSAELRIAVLASLIDEVVRLTRQSLSDRQMAILIGFSDLVKRAEAASERRTVQAKRAEESPDDEATLDALDSANAEVDASIQDVDEFDPSEGLEEDVRWVAVGEGADINEFANDKLRRIAELRVKLEAASRKADHKAVLRFSNQGLALTPKDRVLLGQRACAKANLGDSRGALRDIDRRVALFPKDATSLTLRAAILRHVGYHKKALKDLRKALRFAPLYPGLRERIHQSRRAIVQERRTGKRVRGRSPTYPTLSSAVDVGYLPGSSESTFDLDAKYAQEAGVPGANVIVPSINSADDSALNTRDSKQSE